MKRLFLWVLGASVLVACPAQISDDLATDEFDDLSEIVISETEASSVNLGVSETVLVVDRDTTLRLQALPSGCRTVVAGSETDSDQDGIFEDVTYQYDPAKCVRSIPNGSRSYSGRIRVEDTASNPAIGYRLSYLEFAMTERRFGVVVLTETRNGTRGATLSASKLSLSRVNNISLKLERPSRLVQNLNNQMAFVFTTTSPIVPNATLPAGSIELDGTVQWSRGAFTPRVYTTNTQTALQTDPTCAAQRVIGGVQVLTRGKLTLRFAYQPCSSAPIVTKALAP
jgi:hypothetical protein